MENINDLIYAYSLGCLDDGELQLWRENLEAGEEINVKALVEFQNLASLLPSTLKIENPDPELKDNVAKKLYSLKDEMRAQRQKNKPSTIMQEANKEMEEDSSLIEPEIFHQEDNAPNFVKLEENSTQNPVEVPADIKSEEKVYYNHLTIPVKKNYTVIIGGFALLLLLAIIGVFIYRNISLKTNNLKNEVEKLKKEIGGLNIQLIESQEIREMLQSPDVGVVYLKGTDLSPNSFGKLITGSDRRTGFIHFARMPAIPEDKLFQIWIMVSRNYISLRTFKSSDTLGFYSFKMSSPPKGEDMEFRVTEEPISGSIKPSNKVYLKGTFTP
jgi:hypothetical protein